MIDDSGFKPARLFANRHVQTILPNAGMRLIRRPPMVREVLELPDSDFLHLDWLAGPAPTEVPPLLLCLHGLEGSSKSNYAADLLLAAHQAGWDAAVVHFRGCSGVPNRLARSYHAGETGDLELVLAHIRRTRPRAPLFAVGYSLGGNVLLKHLGERGGDSPLEAGVAVSVPFSLNGASETISSGVARLYQFLLMRKMKQRVRDKATLLQGHIDIPTALASRTFAEFDDAVTAPLHGFDGYLDYYSRCSCIDFLAKIEKPTLIIHAKDDPFIHPRYLPSNSQLSPSVRLELSEHGGHVGFLEQKKPWQPALWLPRRIMQFLSEQATVGPAHD